MATTYGVQVSSKGKTRRNDLTLQQKYNMVKAAEKNPKPGVRKLADDFKCDKTQINTILRDKESIIGLYEAYTSGDSHSRKRKRTSQFSDVNDALYEWYCLAKIKQSLPRWPIDDGEG